MAKLTPKKRAIVEAAAELPETATGSDIKKRANERLDDDTVSQSYVYDVCSTYEKAIEEARADRLIDEMESDEEVTEPIETPEENEEPPSETDHVTTTDNDQMNELPPMKRQDDQGTEENEQKGFFERILGVLFP